MKTVLRILALAVVVAAIILWWQRPTGGFNARWVLLPPAMSLEMLVTARQVARRPTAMTYTYCKYPNCKRS